MLMPPGRVAVFIPLVGHDSNLVVRRIPYDTPEILFHALTQCQRWYRLLSPSWQPPQFTSHRPIFIWHSPPAIRHTRLRVRRPGIGSAWHASHATKCYVFPAFSKI